jgi:predicted transposase/invertase (TIGR01784 family)
MSYLSPKADVTFKKVFANARHKERCISLLNALLPLKPGRQVADIDYLPEELAPRLKTGKTTIVDVRCTDTQGRQFIVEMQMQWTTAFLSRILLNASKALVSQADLGDPYAGIKPVYSLNLLNDIFDRGRRTASKYYHHYGVFDRDDPTRQIEGMEFVLIELPKFKPTNKADARMRDLWLRFLTEIDDGTEKIPPELKRQKEIRDAVACLERTGFTKAQLRAYDKYWDIVSTEKTLILGKYEEGEARGVVKGITQGIAQGVVKGRAEEKREIARSLRAAGMPDTLIAQHTKLPLSEIQGL